MLAYQIQSAGEQAKLREIPVPAPAEGQIRVAIRACGLNFADLLMQKGTYQDTPAAPFTLGLEVAGVVDAVGAGVSHLKPGDRVAVYSGQGGLAQFGVFDADRAVLIPRSCSFEDAAAIQI